MIEHEKTVKIYDKDKNLLGKGYLLSISSETIKVKGQNLPILDINTEIIIVIFHELSGIKTYNCVVSLAARQQLNARIKKVNPIIERRKSLKVRTNLSFYVNSLWRNDEDVSKDFPNMKINILNLSIGGMLISCNYKLNIGDIFAFNFTYKKSQAILLKAKVIRIDEIYDEISENLSIINYGCTFDKLKANEEALITKYLYERQIQLYKNR